MRYLIESSSILPSKTFAFGYLMQYFILFFYLLEISFYLFHLNDQDAINELCRDSDVCFVSSTLESITIKESGYTGRVVLFSSSVLYMDDETVKECDYVVHIHFGIGVFRGLTKREIDGVEKEFLHIDYAPPDRL